MSTRLLVGTGGAGAVVDCGAWGRWAIARIVVRSGRPPGTLTVSPGVQSTRRALSFYAEYGMAPVDAVWRGSFLVVDVEAGDEPDDFGGARTLPSLEHGVAHAMQSAPQTRRG